MTMLRSIKVVAWFACQVLAGAAAGANAQAPESKGPVVKPLLNLDLAPEMDTVQGRAMRMQITIYEPGAANKPHSHKDRPEIAYILSGKIIEHRGEVAKPRRRLHGGPQHHSLDGEQRRRPGRHAGERHRQKRVVARSGWAPCRSTKAPSVSCTKVRFPLSGGSDDTDEEASWDSLTSEL
jgi:quercetin dioxygenase-like cupin family protein